MSTPETAEVVEHMDDAATTVVVEVDTPDTPEPENESAETTVVVVEAAADEGAQNDATQLDHEQRITRTEETVNGLRDELVGKADRADLHAMEERLSQQLAGVVAVAADVAEAVVEDIAEDGDLDGGTVRVEEPDGSVDVVSIDPGSPETTDDGQARKPGLFRW